MHKNFTASSKHESNSWIPWRTRRDFCIVVFLCFVFGFFCALTTVGAVGLWNYRLEEKLCRLTSKSYDPYICSKNGMLPCETKNYRFNYEVTVISDTNSYNSTVCAFDFEFATCSCCINASNHCNEFDAPFIGSEAECMPIINSVLHDYDSLVVGNIYPCWVNTKGTPSIKQHYSEQKMLQINSYKVCVMIGVLCLGSMLLFSIVYWCCYLIKIIETTEMTETTAKTVKTETIV